MVCELYLDKAVTEKNNKARTPILTTSVPYCARGSGQHS